MLKILASVALSLFVVAAHADVVAHAVVSASGDIIKLTDEPCADPSIAAPGVSAAKRFSPDHSTQTGEGCWKIEDEIVYAVWTDGRIGKGRITSFTMGDYTKPAPGKKILPGEGI